MQFQKEFIKKQDVADINNIPTLKPGELVIAMSGATTGKLGFNRTKETFYINQRVGKVSSILADINYLYILLSFILKNLNNLFGLP